MSTVGSDKNKGFDSHSTIACYNECNISTGLQFAVIRTEGSSVIVIR
jgi:hypothetical protein